MPSARSRQRMIEDMPKCLQKLCAGTLKGHIQLEAVRRISEAFS